MPIETVSFDAGGVLVNPNWERVAAALSAQGIQVDAQVLESAEPAAKKRYDRPPTVEVAGEEQNGWGYFNYILEGIGIKPSAATEAALRSLKGYHAEHNLWECVAPGARETLRVIRSRGLKCIVVSNANGRLHGLLDRLDLTRYFDVIVDSFVEQVEKPDPRLFRIAMQRAGAKPERTLHVGDFYHFDVVGARAAGMLPLLIDKADLYQEADCPRVRSVGDVDSFVFGPQIMRGIRRQSH